MYYRNEWRQCGSDGGNEGHVTITGSASQHRTDCPNYDPDGWTSPGNNSVDNYCNARCKKYYTYGTSGYDDCALGNTCVGSSCRQQFSSNPVYGYITRTRLKVCDKQSGLFSHGVGVPYAALNNGLYSTPAEYV